MLNLRANHRLEELRKELQAKLEESELDEFGKCSSELVVQIETGLRYIE